MRLIDADAIKLPKGFFEKVDNVPKFYEWLSEQPTIDPVKRGRWELAEDGWYCSACELYPPFDCDPEEKGIPFCPWCGALMREDGEEE